MWNACWQPNSRWICRSNHLLTASVWLPAFTVDIHCDIHSPCGFSQQTHQSASPTNTPSLNAHLGAAFEEPFIFNLSDTCGWPDLSSRKHRSPIWIKIQRLDLESCSLFCLCLSKHRTNLLPRVKIYIPRRWNVKSQSDLDLNSSKFTWQCVLLGKCVISDKTEITVPTSEDCYEDKCDDICKMPNIKSGLWYMLSKF